MAEGPSVNLWDKSLNLLYNNISFNFRPQTNLQLTLIILFKIRIIKSFNNSNYINVEITKRKSIIFL